LAIDERTIDRYLASHEAERKQNGYRILKGKSLKNLKLAQVDDIHVADLISTKVSAPRMPMLLQAHPRKTVARCSVKDCQAAWAL
jgi:hypothetical protein